MRRFSSLLALVLLVAGQAHGARLLKAYFDVDGKAVLLTYYDDNGRAGPAKVWRYLGEQPILVAKEPGGVAPDAENPKTAVLAGKVRIRVQHTDRIIVEATVERVRLVRKDATTRKWFLPADEVERIAKAAGIGE